MVKSGQKWRIVPKFDFFFLNQINNYVKPCYQYLRS